MNTVRSLCSAERGFSAGESSGVSARENSPFGSHHDIRNGARSCSVLMIRNCSRKLPPLNLQDAPGFSRVLMRARIQGKVLV